MLLCAGLAIAVANVQIDMISLEGEVRAPMLLTLIDIALAVALIALATMTSNAKDLPVIEAEIIEIEHATGVELASQDMRIFCNSQLDDYFAGIKGELNQADRLVSDAVGNLVASFKYINKLTRSQQEVSLSIVKAAAPENSEFARQLLDRQAAIADQIEQEVDTAVTSLQFGDLVAQLLGHTMVRVEALGTALQRIDRQDAGQESREYSWRPQRIHEGISRAVMAANATSRRKPVVQQGMQTGGVELF